MWCVNKRPNLCSSSLSFCLYVYSHFCFHCLLLTGHMISQLSISTNHTCFHEAELKKMLTENVKKMTRHLNEQKEALKMLEQINDETNARQHQELKVALSQSSTVPRRLSSLEQLCANMFAIAFALIAYFGIKRMYCDLSRPHSVLPSTSLVDKSKSMATFPYEHSPSQPLCI